MDDDVRTRLAGTFQQGAEAYDRYRPGFPDALFADLRDTVGDRLHGRVLEVGAGTGLATVPLVRAGARVEVVEPSQDMLDVLDARLREAGLADRVTARRATFEDVDPDERYDVVVSAQAFHWADPATRWTRMASLLGDDGRAVMFWNDWWLDEEAHDTAAVARLYEELAPDVEPDLAVRLSRLQWVEDEVAATPGLALTALDHYPWTWALPTPHYAGLLATTSQYAVLPDDPRARLLAALGDELGATTRLTGRTASVVVAPAA